MYVGRKVEVLDGESIERALHRLRVTQQYEYKRWTKRRYGYFEKPSALRRKQRKMAKLWTQMDANAVPAPRQGAQHRLHLFIGLVELFARSGPSNQAGK